MDVVQVPTDLYCLLRERVSSLLGPRMGEATLRLQCELAGVEPEALHEDKVDQMLEQLKVVLCIYAGRPVAEQWVRSLLTDRAAIQPRQTAS